MLADHAQVADGKLFIAGGGWSQIGPGPCPSAIALDLKVPWDRRDDEHTIRFELVDGDGQAVLVPTPQGVQPFWIQGVLNIGEVAPGVKPGSWLDAPFAVNLPPVPLPPGGSYTWMLIINGETHEDWRVSFSTRAAQAAA